MEKKEPKAAGLSAKALVAAGLAVALSACAACTAAPEAQEGSASVGDAPVAAADGGEDGAPGGTGLGGLDTEWLDEGQREGLEAALAGYFGEGADLRVVGGPATVGQATVTYVEDLGSGGFYEARLYPDDKWAVGPLRQLVDGVNAQGADAPEDGLDATGPLTAREATFDAGNCVPASDAAALSELLGERCASSLPGLLSEFLESHGSGGVTALDIMVERDVAQANGKASFKALAVSGNDRIVIDCEWAEADGSLSAEILG